MAIYAEADDFRTHGSEIDALIAVLSAVGVRLTAEMTMLDVGGGQGMHVGFLSALAGKVFCADVVDYSSLYNGEFLKLLDEKHRRNHIEFHLDRVAFHQTDAMNLMYRDALFDCVVSINSFEHIPDPGKALAEMIRVSRTGGHIYISTDPIWTADTGSHFFHRVPEPWAHLLYDGATFAEKMLENGATADETAEYGRAMNRWRAKDYARVVQDVASDRRVDILHHDSWSGVCDPSHRQHENLRHLARRGFSESELMIRGFRWVFRKR
jgi:ubiquinone/menaquinone biosynthesis C-methylase UbiE